MFEAFIEKNFAKRTLAIIEQANEIIDEYQSEGYVLTLRQLYYQFVARDLISNSKQSYDRLGSIINDGRLAGYIDWQAIEDRTRNLVTNYHAANPRSAIQQIRNAYGLDMWANQPTRVEVWIEKEALAGVIARICDELDVPYFACRGYVSQSESWRAYKRFERYEDANQDTIILHLGDHDPSGVDMTRDNEARQIMFFQTDVYGSMPVEVRRIALNMDQIKKYKPPPNPAKITDSRAKEYIREFGNKSWELDALEPRVLSDLVRKHVEDIRDPELWDERCDELQTDLETFDTIIESL